MYIPIIIKEISDNRNAIYGISIILVILYHCYCNNESVFFLPFEKGFIGVDIFLLLSGYGLCHSYNNNNLRTFYKRRFMRILPAYMTYNVLFFLMAAYYFKKPMSIADFFYNISTLSFYGFGYYGGGNKCFDWYTAAILLLYLLFPLLYKIARKVGVIMFILLCLFASVYNHFISVPWRIDCLISRVPVFVFGILLYFYKKDLLQKEKNSHMRIVFLLLPAFIYAGLIYSTWFFQTAMVAPFILLIVNGLISLLQNTRIYCALSYLGKYSYELMVANSWSQQWGIFIPKIFPLNVVCFILFHLIAQLLFIGVGKTVKVFIK